MPDVVEETTDKYGNKIIKIWYASYQGENKFVNLTIKQAAAVADNIDRIYQFVDKNEKNWKGKK
jgi:predicted secreted protein